MSIYIDGFWLPSNIISTLKALKKSLSIEHNINDFENVDTIIKYQI